MQSLHMSCIWDTAVPRASDPRQYRLLPPRPEAVATTLTADETTSEMLLSGGLKDSLDGGRWVARSDSMEPAG